MSLNKIILEGKIISDIRTSGDEGNEFASFLLGITKNYKSKDDQYYPSIAISCKSFKRTAAFIAKNFSKMSKIAIVGQLDQDAEYTRPDGTVKAPEFYVRIDEAYFTGDKESNTNGSEEASAASKSAHTTNSPFASGTKPANNNPLTSNSPLKRTNGLGGR